MNLRAHVERARLGREQLIARYCAGRMGDDEATTFEAEFLADSTLAADVERTMLLRDALQESGVTSTASAQVPMQHWPWLSLAAGILIGAVGIRAMYAPGGNTGVIDDVEFLTLGVVRSTEPVLAKPSLNVAEHSLLILEVPAAAATETIDLVTPDGQTRTLHGTRDQGFLRIALSPPVEPGDYAVVSGPVRHAFRVEPSKH